MLENVGSALRRRLTPKAELGVRAPSPMRIPVVGHVPLLRRDRLDHLMRTAITWGDVVRFDFPGFTAHMLSHPDHVQRVLVDEQRLFTKQTRGYEKLKAFLGNGLVTSEGSFWLRQRRIAQPAFAKKRVAGFGATMVKCTEDLFSTWDAAAKSGETRDVHADMMHLTLRIAALTLLSSDPSDKAGEIGAALDVVLHEANARINSLLDVPEWIPTSRNRRYAQASQALDGIVMGMIEARRRGEAEDDLLQMLLEAKDEETGERMDDRQLRDEVMTMFLAGHETTANALTWTLHLLSRAPSVARGLADEAGSVLGDRSPVSDDAARLDLSRRVLFESMRLYPPVWILGRAPSEDVSFGGYPIAARSIIFLPQWVVHRHPQFWENPEGFDPERFTPDRMKVMHKGQYFPFAGGPRMCIGAGFATLEGQLILSMLARRYRVDVVPGFHVEPEPLITLRPRHGLRATIHRR